MPSTLARHHGCQTSLSTRSRRPARRPRSRFRCCDSAGCARCRRRQHRGAPAGAFSSSTVRRGSTSGQPPSRIIASKSALPPFRRQHDARQRARIFVDVGVLGARDEFEIARLERLVDLLDRHAGRDEAHAEQVFQRRAIGGHQRRESAAARRRPPCRPRAVARSKSIEPQRVVPEQMIEAVDQPDVRPVIGDADQFDAVAAVGRGGGLELGLQQRDGFVGRCPGAAPRNATAAARSTRSARCSSRDRRR